MSPIFAIITGPEIAIVVGIAILLFGADRIPKLARSMGEAKKEFEAAQRGQSAQPPAAAPAAPPAEPSAPQNPPAPPPPAAQS
jgi:sec-independent protein translocase protein TatA